jgi:sterol desaturase/sphingolipid hydroxylase (fatty acid hydroxylase superfamily)
VLNLPRSGQEERVLILLTIVIASLLTLAELAAGDTLKGARWVNIQATVLYSLTGMFIAPFVAVAVPVSLLSARDMPWWLGAILFFLVIDFLSWAFHRAQHAIPFMWSMHSLHHSDESMNATTAGRHFWVDRVLKAMTTFPLGALIIHPTPELALANALFNNWNFLSHANLKWHWGPLTWLLNSPAYHRIHHSTDPRHFNSNFANYFPIWDVIAGTYRRPDCHPQTGLTFSFDVRLTCCSGQCGGRCPSSDLREVTCSRLNEALLCTHCGH